MSESLLEKVVNGQRLDRSELQQVFAKMLNGSLSPAEIAGFLTAWRIHGITSAHFAVGANFMREHAVAPVLSNRIRPLVDNCGTGGSGFPKFNVSTAAAIVAATCGAKMAKHGSKSVSSKCGSADLLFAAGFPEKIAPEKTIEILEECSLTFFYAPNFHPVMKHVMPTRKALGIRTIFNLLGPLANPIQPEFQLLGVGAARYVRPVAEALADLGVERALVVHSDDGLDEISPAAPTPAIYVEGTSLRDYPIDPKDFGIKATLEDLRGGDPATNLALLNQLLDGKDDPIADAVALNAGAVLWLCGKAPDFSKGFVQAKDALLSGSARQHFDRWIAKAQA